MLKEKIVRLAKKAKEASRELANLSAEKKNNALLDMADALIRNKRFLLEANQKDLRLAESRRLSSAIIDRLTLSEKRIRGMSDSLAEVAKLKDPLGEVISLRKRPNGLIIKKIRVPIGVIGIIYESRPNVTSDCIGLCLKSGNSVILRGGSEAINSNLAIFEILKSSAKRYGIPENSFNLIDSTDRRAVGYILELEGLIDLIIPRGGEGLIREVSRKSRIPVIKHYKGVCHIFVDRRADLEMAKRICYNAKVQRPGVCNAMETLLVHKDIAKRFLPEMAEEFGKAGVELRGCPKTRGILKGIKAAEEDDWYTEYLDLILSVKVVSNLKEAIEHITKYGSQHSDSIITEDKKAGMEFLKKIDSACVYLNASTRFTDGSEFGMGAEIGISTDKIHARGPMALEELTTYKYIIFGKGQIRM